jgi:hypothetical protein
MRCSNCGKIIPKGEEIKEGSYFDPEFGGGGGETICYKCWKKRKYGYSKILVAFFIILIIVGLIMIGYYFYTKNK